MEIITRSEAKNKDIRVEQNRVLSLIPQRNFDDELTLEYLKSLKPMTVFAHGFTRITHPWFNDANNVDRDGRSALVRYVIVRGSIHTWSIYHSMDANLVGFEGYNYFNGTTHLYSLIDSIARFGAKLHDEQKIREMISCTDEVFSFYNF